METFKKIACSCILLFLLIWANTHTYAQCVLNLSGITYTVTQKNIDCFGSSTGQVDVQINGTTFSNNYTYILYGGLAPLGTSIVTTSKTCSFTNLIAANYILLISIPGEVLCSQPILLTTPLDITLSGNVTPPKCSGGSDGIINLNVTGGTPPYSYSWSNLTTNQNLTGIGSGIYSVKVTDANNCEKTASYTVGSPNNFVLSGSSTNTTCNGGNNGSINLSVSGATPPYSFHWDDDVSITSSNRTNLKAGIYTVHIKDANNCNKDTTFNIIEPTPLSVIAVLNNINCNGDADGSISLSVSGGTAPYTFNWPDNGSTSQNRTNLAPGTYNVKIKDNNSCELDTFFTITQPTPLALTAVATNSTCGMPNGSIDITSVTGGTAPYLYSWVSGPATQDRTGLIAGTYTIEITDANGCQIDSTFTINSPVAISLIATVINASCGLANGAININAVSGGTAPYTFTWGDGVTTQNRTGLGTGNYSLKIRDVNGCEKDTSFNITNPAAYSVVAIITNTSCTVNNGAITLNVSGGTTPYTFLWNDLITSQNRTGLAAGTYSVKIKDASGCEKDTLFTIIKPIPFSVTAVVINPICSTNSGSINLSVNGGTTPYSFLWPDNGSTSQNRTSLGGGSYLVKITDGSGCSKDSTFNITQPAPMAMTATVTNPNCNGAATGSINVTSVSGGTAPFSYALNGTASTQNNTNLAAGTYTVTVTDSKGCKKDSTFTLTQPAPFVIDSSSTNETCDVLDNGKININSVSGGVAPYAFNWSNGAVSQNVTNLASGNYSVIISDANGCSDTIGFTINAPIPMTIDTNVTKPTCVGGNDGAIQITSVSGGTGPYSFFWDSGETTKDINGLYANTYGLTIMDNSACTQSFTIIVDDPAPISAESTITDESCTGNDGSISLIINGGTAPYSFEWLDNGTTTQDRTGLMAGPYSVIVTDSKGCSGTFNFTVNHSVTISITPTITNVKCYGGSDGKIELTISGGVAPYSNFEWSNGATTQELIDVKAGTYKVKFSDDKGCNYQSQDFIVNQPTPLAITANISEPVCKGSTNGTITITSVTGGTAPYTYLWPENVTTQGISNLGKGTYKLTVTDANGCTLDSNFVIEEPDGFTYDTVKTNITCNGSSDGSINVNVTSGGSSPYSYLWDSGETANNIQNLGKGAHSVKITDAGGCSETLSFTINEPAPLHAKSIVTNVQCYKGSNGSIEMTPTGGTPAYSYLWSTLDTDAKLSNLTPGTYDVKITDQNSCRKDTTFIITQPDTLIVDHASAVKDVSCNGKSDGQIELHLNISGGTGPYSNYEWTPSTLTGPNNYDLPAGIYFVTFKDAKNCTYKDMFEINEPLPMQLTPVVNPNPICKSKTVTITIPEVYIGYSFDGGKTFQKSNMFSRPIYSDTLIKIVVKDNICESKVDSVKISIEKLIIDNLSKDVSCFGKSDGIISLANFKGGSGQYLFALDGGIYQQSSTFTGLKKGIYAVSIYDVTGCPYDDYPVEIKEPQKLVLGIDTIMTIKPCANSNNGEIHLEVAGGNGGFKYSINNGTYGTAPVFTNLSQNDYFVKVIDKNGCADSLSAKVTAPDTINISKIVEEITGVKCFGDENGSIKLSNITGGLQPYIFTLNGTKNNTGEFDNLSGGKSTLVISNKDDQCPVSYPFEIPEPEQIRIIMSDVKQITCSNEGSVTINGVGGSTPYLYAIDTNTYETKNVFSNLFVNTYRFKIKDANNCVAYADTTLIRIGPMPYIRTKDVPCFNEKKGEIYIDSLQRPGQPYITYYLYNIDTTTKNVIPDLGAGIYSMGIKNGDCDVPFPIGGYYLFNGTDYDTIYNSNIIINEPEPITAETFVIKSSREINSGTIYVYDIQGGTPFYLISNDDLVYSTYVLADSTLNSYSNLAPGEYKIYIKDGNGCKLEKEVVVGSGFFIPNMFTPNGDGKNDRFEIMSIPYGSKFYVHNRWGSRVFASDNYDNSWDGEDQPDGVYFYDLLLPNGKAYKGWIEIIR
ncbi:MAG: gliding motility-associated C-terminal domain-containing protein [Sporocytophaga sp.]|uniref:T9SS type B sorting domain-containing protein n=1 Tax=Sporocytophaga sp. TaxID=2231183 RepID=UPI001B2E6FB6|nr:gliding motility-associated C-terminal domain-containing protein [Sporocytophaga sp.]MBO9702666.1 gliding motility-associated C-terminal domain-containing protein [Sporocytophaga sp.]